jgi:hypothetical protein
MINLNNIVAKGRMTSKRVIFGLVIACFMGLGSQANALTISSGEYLGVVSPDGGSPASEATEITHLVGLTPGTFEADFNGDSYDRSSNILCFPTCPAATDVGAVKDDTSPSTTVDVTGFTYLLAKYDASQAGGYIWYVADLTGDQTIPSNLGTCGATGCGLSHWTLFNPEDGTATPSGTPSVPEPSSLILLGAGLIASRLILKRATTRKA